MLELMGVLSSSATALSLRAIEHKGEDKKTKIADLSKGVIENIHDVQKTTLETISDAGHTSKSEIEQTVCSGISKFETVAANERYKIVEGIHFYSDGVIIIRKGTLCSH